VKDPHTGEKLLVPREYATEVAAKGTDDITEVLLGKELGEIRLIDQPADITAATREREEFYKDHPELRGENMQPAREGAVTWYSNPREEFNRPSRMRTRAQKEHALEQDIPQPTQYSDIDPVELFRGVGEAWSRPESTPFTDVRRGIQREQAAQPTSSEHISPEELARYEELRQAKLRRDLY
jgi:hypothetical protein